MKPRISLVVTDLDNTLYDWVGFFVPALYAMVEVAAPLLEISSDHLLDELRSVHQLHGTTEKPFALLDVPAVERRFPRMSQVERMKELDPAFHAFNRVRKHSLVLYNGVEETLKTIKERGATIVAHTDAHANNALFRLKQLSLTTLIMKLYAPEANQRSRAEGIYMDAEEYVRPLPDTDRKPNPQVLLDICRAHRTTRQETLYVGDSLTRDIGMANAAGTHSAWAAYGAEFSQELWTQLVRVTHWTKEDAEREARMQAIHEKASPDVTLTSFSDLLAHFDFCRKATQAGSRRSLVL